MIICLTALSVGDVERQADQLQISKVPVVDVGRVDAVHANLELLRALKIVVEDQV